MLIEKTLFVEKVEFFFWNMYFLVEGRCCKKGFLQKENAYFFLENLCGKGLLHFKDQTLKKKKSSIKAN